MKKIWALALAAIMLACALASCATGGDTTEAMKDYDQTKDYVIDDKGNTFYFEEAEGESAVLVKYVGKATTGDKVVIPDKFGDRTVTKIGDDAFYNLTAIAEVTIPDTVIAIGAHAFAGCTGLTVVNLPAGVEVIGEAAFWGCTSLTTLNDADHPLTALTTIAKNAFRGCSALAVINGGNLPETLETIGDAAFWGCASLTSVEFPESVKSIGALAYYDCTGLTYIKLHNGFEKDSIGQFAFTTETSTLKDKIDLIGITNEYVLAYVAAIAEPTEEETLGDVELDTEDESEGELESEGGSVEDVEDESESELESDI